MHVLHSITCLLLCVSVVQNRELEVDIYWKEGNVLCGILYLKLEDFFDTAACTLCLPLEPQGILLAEVCVDHCVPVLFVNRVTVHCCARNCTVL